MSINPNDPLTWTRPKWSKMSCYVNSALWGLLYNDSFINIINMVNTAILTKDNSRICEPKDIDKLKTELGNYRNGIFLNDNTINEALTDIRQILQKCSSNELTKWDTQTGDSYEFLQIINGLFINTEEEVSKLINGDPTKGINGDPTKARNYVVSTSTQVITLDQSSQLKDEAIYNNLFSTTPNIQAISYQILPLISTSTSENTGAMFDIANTQNGNDQIITVTDTSVFDRTISEDDATKNYKTKYSGLNDGTIVEKGIKYIKINSIKTTIQTYNLNNNSSGIVIGYDMKQKIVTYGNASEVWKELDNNIQDKYFRIGRYNLSAFSCWYGSNHYTCYFRFNDKWYIMNDNPNETLLVDHTDEEFKHKLFRNSFLFFYSYNSNNKDNSNELCSKIFDYDIKEKQREINAKLLSTPRTSAPRSSWSQGPVKGQTSTFNSSLQMTNNCEKYGQDWLNLFIDENAAPGTPVNFNRQNGTASFTNSSGIFTTVQVSQNCTFVPGAAQPQAPPRASSPSSTLEQEADAALEAAKLLTIKSQAVSDRVKEAQKGNNDTDITPYVKNVKPDKDRLENGNLIFFNGAVYVAGYLNSNQNDIKLYKVDDNTICELDGTNCQPYNDSSDPFTLIVQKPPAAAPGQQQPLPAAKPENIKSTKGSAPIFKPLKFTNIGPTTTAQINTIVDKINRDENINVYNTEDITLDNKTVGAFINNTSYVKNDSCFKKDDNYYIPITATTTSGSTPVIKWYDIYNESICNIGLASCKTQTANKFDGGTKRNKNIKFGTRKGKGKRNLRKGIKTKKGKRTRKLIRNKNKFKTNKLKTNKLRRRTRKA